MKRSFWITALAACLLWGGIAQAGTGMTVSPSRFRLVKPAGQAASDKVLVTNSSTYPMQVTTETTDMVLLPNEDGLSIRDEAPPGTTPYSCARWIQMTEGTKIIPPGESAQMEFVVSPPPEAQSGGYGAYLFFIGRPIMPERAEGDKAAVQLVTVPRLGVAVVYEVEGTIRRAGELLRLEVTPPSGAQPLKVRHEFKNAGNAEIVLTGNFHVMDPNGLLVGKGTLRTLKTFPQETGLAETTWQEELPPGRYTLMITFELGPDAEQVIVREIPLEIKA